MLVTPASLSQPAKLLRGSRRYDQTRLPAHARRFKVAAMTDHKRLQFEQAARAWGQKTGACVWVDNYGVVTLENAPSGFASMYSAGDFFAKIGGRFTEAPKREFPLRLKFTAQQYHAAHKAYGANCGYGAAAAIVGITLDDVRKLVPGAEKAGGIGINEMKSAIARCGWRVRDIGSNPPSYGVAVVKFGGSENPGHWVAVCGDKILDSHSMSLSSGWIDAEKWGREIAPKVAKYFPGTNEEWWFDCGIEAEEMAR